MQYEIQGGMLPVLLCTLENDESMITERGAMSWMTPNIEMKTSTNGGVGKALGRLLSKESMFQNNYTARGGQGMIAFASSFPGSIMEFDINDNANIIVQKSGFLASESTVNLSLHFKPNLGAGFFGGEGFIMQRLSGHGKAFIEIDGFPLRYDLRDGQSLVLSSGYIAAMSDTCDIKVKAVPGIKNMFFGGEGIFNTIVTGPGFVILQTQPLTEIAKSIIPYIPMK